MRIGTWNLQLCPRPDSTRGVAVADWLKAQGADLWLLTEVRHDWPSRGGDLVVSPPRGVGPVEKRWAGIETALPLASLRTAADDEHPAEEGLCFARLVVDGASTVLVACSVLPWRGAAEYWPGLPSGGQVTQLRYVLGHHIARIEAERLPGERLVWGGDFNQQLTRPFACSTVAGAEALGAAFQSLGLVAMTDRAEHLNLEMSSIDHLSVSTDLVDGDAVATVHRPEANGRRLSDHAAYTASILLPGAR